MPTALEEELKTFEAHRTELLGRAKGQFVLIKGNRIVDTFVSQEDALKRGYQEFGNSPFLVKQILDVELPMNFTSFLIAV
jgi:hypothetical protein